MKRFRIAIEYIKTAIIALLIVSAVCLFVAYMFEFQNLGGKHAIEFDRMRILSGSDNHGSYDVSSDCIFPAAFAYSCDGGKYLFTGSRSLYQTAYSEALGYLKTLYSSASYCAEITDNADAVWDYCTSRDFVYLLYQKPLPVSALCLFSGNDGGDVKDAVQGELPYIREIFILSSDPYLSASFLRATGITVSPASGDICAAARSADGKIYLLFGTSSLSDVKFDKQLFSAYNKNDSVCAFSFMKELDEPILDAVRGPFSDTVIIPSKSASLNDVVIETATAADFGSEAVLRFLEDIGINTTKMRHYEGVEGEEIYISESFVFRISNGGALSYQASGEPGIPVSELLGYSKAGSYGLFDSLTAAGVFMSRVTSDFGGACFGSGVFSFTLTDCVYDNGSLRLEYRYCSDGIMLKGVSAAKLTIVNGSIVSAELNAVKASTSGGRIKPEPAVWTLETAASGYGFSDGKTLSGLRLVYAKDDGVYRARWEVTAV